jgi:hypothetical protein
MLRLIKNEDIELTKIEMLVAASRGYKLLALTFDGNDRLKLIYLRESRRLLVEAKQLHDKNQENTLTLTLEKIA